jgi:hypothetical protein
MPNRESNLKNHASVKCRVVHTVMRDLITRATEEKAFLWEAHTGGADQKDRRTKLAKNESVTMANSESNLHPISELD